MSPLREVIMWPHTSPLARCRICGSQQQFHSNDGLACTMTTIAEMVAHVKAAPRGSGHHGHWTGCTKQVPPAVWGCATHWYKLPLALRRSIWSSYKPGQEDSKTPSRASVEAAQAVRDWIAVNHSPEAKLL